MEYIVILDNTTRQHGTIDNSHSFIEIFSSYEQAKYEAEQWKENGDCTHYGIYVLCSDNKNYLV